MSYLDHRMASARAAQQQGAEAIGVLLVNLGTPEGTGYWAVRRYLSEFLSDRRVIEQNPLWWQPLLQGVILASQPFRTGAAYREIWCNETNESPLRRYTRHQADNVRARWPADQTGVVVDWAMRYGRPSIAERLNALSKQGCGRILIVPLYPQYSATTTATVNDEAFRTLTHMRYQPAVRTASSFPDHSIYIGILADRIQSSLAGLGWEPR
jgi:protoporphyrin/coproporphyrin ferrochelatase